MDSGALDRRRLLGAVAAIAATLAGCPAADDGDADETERSPRPSETEPVTPGGSTETTTPATPGGSTETTTPATMTPAADVSIEVTGGPADTVAVGDTLTVTVAVSNTGEASGGRILSLTAGETGLATEFVEVAAGERLEVELTAKVSVDAGTYTLAVDGEAVGDVTVEQPVIHVDPDGADDALGTAADPHRTIAAALDRAQPGQTVRLAPGEYRELVRTVRDGEPDAPITVRGPPEAVIRPKRDVNDCVLIEHHHFHLRGMTVDGLARPDEKFEDYEAWMPRLVNISPRARRDEGVEYIRGAVVEPSRLGNCARAMVQAERTRDTVIGNFEVIGPAGMQFDERVDNHEVGHIREVVYVGSPEVHRGEPYYGYETLDRSRNIRIHHIDNSAGYRHNELVDVKLGSTDVTVEYCTTRNAGHNTESGVDPAIALRGNDCTVRWNDLAGCPLPFSFGAWAPSADVDGGDWSRDNDVYGNVVTDIAAGPFRLRNVDDSGPVSFADQGRLCGNDVVRGDPDYARWVGDANGYDGGAVDRRGQDEVTVTVGAGPEHRSLDPGVVLVDPGTTVTWEWTGDDEHYVVRAGRVDADPDTVPDTRAAPYSESESFPEVGLYRFVCYDHHDEGMRGAVVVVPDESRYAFARGDCDGVPTGDGVGHTGGDGRWS